MRCACSYAQFSQAPLVAVYRCDGARYLGAIMQQLTPIRKLDGMSAASDAVLATMYDANVTYLALRDAPGSVLAVNSASGAAAKMDFILYSFPPLNLLAVSCFRCCSCDLMLCC